MHLNPIRLFFCMPLLLLAAGALAQDTASIKPLDSRLGGNRLDARLKGTRLVAMPEAEEQLQEAPAAPKRNVVRERSTQAYREKRLREDNSKTKKIIADQL